jgi:transcriptional regulator with XRE-family HTH domain
MKEIQNLRFILSRNIKAARNARHLTQAKLAEYADISLIYMTEIECCKTWVSDRTLSNIANALNLDVYELFLPLEAETPSMGKKKPGRSGQKIAELAHAKKKILKKAAADVLDDLVQEIIRLQKE